MRKTTLIGIFVVIAILIGIWVVSTTESIYTQPSQLGGWGQEIVLTFADGTSKAIPIEGTGTSTAWWQYSGSPITMMTYNLYAAVITDNPDATTIEFQQNPSTPLTITVKQPATPTFTLAHALNINPAGALTLLHQTTTPTTDQYVKIFYTSFMFQDPAFTPLTTVGTYSFTFTATGSLQYKTNVNTAWSNQPMTLTQLTLTVSRTNDYQFYFNNSPIVTG